jgi:Phosphodiester glycosidase
MISQRRFRFFALGAILLIVGMGFSLKPGAFLKTHAVTPVFTLQLRQERFPLTAKGTPQAWIHWIQIPPATQYPYWVVEPQAYAKPQLVSVEAPSLADGGAKLRLNAGFFDPLNGKSTSWGSGPESLNALNPTENPRLMASDALKPYMPAILNRSEWRLLDCKSPTGLKRFTYQIALHDQALPEGCHLQSAIGAGPRLLPALTAESEGFYAKSPAGKVLRDPIGVSRRAARSAVGLLANGSVLLVMVAKPDNTQGQGGMTLPELAAWLQQRGAVEALNLDGGGSASMWVGLPGGLKQTRHGDRDKNGLPIQRKVLSTLAVVRI